MKTIYHHLICPFQRHQCCAFFISSLSKGKAAQRAFFMRIDEPHRGSAFDSPGLPNDSAGYPGLIRSVGGQRHRCCAFLISSAEILNTKYEHIHIQRKHNTDGVAHSHTSVGRVTRFARQPCPIKNGTPVGFTLFLNHILYEITKTISGGTSLSKRRGLKESVFHEDRRTP